MPIRSIALLIFTCSVFMNLSGLMVFAGFEINRGYIAKELCENRNQPRMHCQGKCYLMKKLRQAREKEQKEIHEIQKVYLQEAFVILSLSITNYANVVQEFSIPFTTGIPVARIYTVFQPPQYS